MNEILLSLPAPIACHSEWDQLLRTLLRQVLNQSVFSTTGLSQFWHCQNWRIS